MSSIKFMGLEIADDFDGSADGFISYVDTSVPEAPVVRRKYFSVVYNDQTIFHAKFKEDTNPSFFNKMITGLLAKLNETKFVEESIVFAIKFYYRKEKFVPSITAAVYKVEDRLEVMVEGTSPAFYNYKKQPAAKIMPSKPTIKPEGENKAKHNKHKKPYKNLQKPANESKPIVDSIPVPEIDNTPPQPATAESLSMLSEHFSIKS